MRHTLQVIGIHSQMIFELNADSPIIVSQGGMVGEINLLVGEEVLDLFLGQVTFEEGTLEKPIQILQTQSE